MTRMWWRRIEWDRNAVVLPSYHLIYISFPNHNRLQLIETEQKKWRKKQNEPNNQSGKPINLHIPGFHLHRSLFDYTNVWLCVCVCFFNIIILKISLCYINVCVSRVYKNSIYVDVFVLCVVVLLVLFNIAFR